MHKNLFYRKNSSFTLKKWQILGCKNMKIKLKASTIHYGKVYDLEHIY